MSLCHVIGWLANCVNELQVSLMNWQGSVCTVGCIISVFLIAWYFPPVRGCSKNVYWYFVYCSVFLDFCASFYLVQLQRLTVHTVIIVVHSHYVWSHSVESWLSHFSPSPSSPSLSIIAGFGNRQAASPRQANLHKSFHSGYPLQTTLYNICLHLRVHRPSHLLFLCSPPPPQSTLCELNKSCH